jgi:hypothetical protein
MLVPGGERVILKCRKTPTIPSVFSDNVTLNLSNRKSLQVLVRAISIESHNLVVRS